MFQVFVYSDKEFGTQLYMLTLDFGRWLSESGDFEPVCAEVLREHVLECFLETLEKDDPDAFSIYHDELDEYLGGKLIIFNMQVSKVVGTMVGLWHYYDFLEQIGLVSKEDRLDAREILGDLWKDVRRALGQDYTDYEFIIRRLPLPRHANPRSKT